VTASQVAGSHGALALYLLPRYLLINTLDVPVQYKQQVGGVLPARACCLPLGALAELLLAAVSLNSLKAGSFLLRKALSCPTLGLGACLPYLLRVFYLAGHSAGEGAAGGCLLCAALVGRAAPAAPLRPHAGGWLAVEWRLRA
jgi:hypothetical protein